MATLTLGGKTVLTQTGSDEPVIGSNLTGSPALNLSGSTFPAGHVIKYYSQTRSSGLASINHDITTSWTKISLGGNFDISGVTATQGNKLRLTMANLNWHNDDDNTYQTALAITTDGTTASEIIAHWGGYDNDTVSTNWGTCFIWEYTVPAGFTNKTLSVITRKQTGAPGGQWSWNLQQNANVSAASSAVFSIEEIQV